MVGKEKMESGVVRGFYVNLKLKWTQDAITQAGYSSS